MKRQVMSHPIVIPAKAGIQCRRTLDCRLRGNDGFSDVGFTP